MIACMLSVFLLPGFSVIESRDIRFPSGTEHLEHVQNIHVDRLGPVEQNVNIRFFISSLSLIFQMKEHSE